MVAIMSNDKQTTAKDIQDVVDPNGETDTGDNFYKMLADNHNEFLANSKESRAKFVDAVIAIQKDYEEAFRKSLKVDIDKGEGIVHISFDVPAFMMSGDSNE